MKTTHQIAYFIFLLIGLQNCNAQEVPQELPVPEGYEGCCGMEPMVMSWNGASVYVPNTFTPNGDGVNDYFMPYVNDGVEILGGFTILSANGDTILFQRNIFRYDLDYKEYAWNGMRPDGTIHKGPFQYAMRADAKNVDKRLINGFACSIPCSPTMAVFKTKEGCYYPAQAGAGVLDTSKSNGEGACYE